MIDSETRKSTEKVARILSGFDKAVCSAVKAEERKERGNVQWLFLSALTEVGR